MKRIIITLFLFSAGMTVFSQDMSYYIQEFTRTDGSFAERLALLETVQEARLNGVGEFYHEALRYFLRKAPDIKTIEERAEAEKSARILCNGLGEEKYSAAAPEIWMTVVFYDVAKTENDGSIMQDALIALGKVDGKNYLPQIIQRLDSFNSQTFTAAEARRFAQRGVTGCVNALETLRDPSGYRPVFFVYVGNYDVAIKNIAYAALPKILDDPGNVISEIISDASNDPRVKLEAWREMLKTSAPAGSKAKTASTALAVCYSYNTSDRILLRNLTDMKKSAIDAIAEFGVSDDSVYENLEKTYSSSFNNNSPDYDDIQKTLNTLAAIKSDDAVKLLTKFLQGLHERRRSGPWGRKERTVFEWVISSIAGTGTKDVNVRMLLSTIQRANDYTAQEQNMAANALNTLN
jgi:hypothetical protein